MRVAGAVRRRLAALVTAAPPATVDRDVTSGEPPIFVHGMSRTGGTLMATILDAHPEVAMSYELYPDLLELDDGSADAVRALAARFEAATSLRRALAGVETPVRTFFLRSERSGLDHRELGALLRGHALDDDFTTAAGRLRFIGRCARAKMRKVGKRRWGAKASLSFDDYRSVWPDARFVGMLRDGRDVLASQQNTGSFSGVAAEVGRDWREHMLTFRALVADPEVHAFEMRYESLVADPETQVQALAAFLGVPYDEKMLRYHQEDLTVFAAHHLSMDRITLPVDATQVGRWQRDVSPEDVAAFWAEAGEAMAELGYGERC